MINLYSTMLLLYHLCDDRGIDCKPIYIPLCFYFIDPVERFTLPVTSIYIPLCFYFIGDDDMWVEQTKKFTFHYASTLSLPDPLLALKYCNLHSTMLLLYPVRDAAGSGWAPDLHSTMLLLYRIVLTEDGKIDKIYIPLCFYFIVCLCCYDCAGYLIYIPLCFYFIITKIRTEMCVTQFTFHYASTLSGIQRCHQIYDPIFTFHYASTLSEADPPALQPHIIIYIPLCFYFISEYWPYSIATIRFTFHYASTLSHDLWAPAEPVSHHLHSTMLLLYPAQAANEAAEAIFTFHYASTLSNPEYYRERIIDNLHSTMLLLYLFHFATAHDACLYLHSTMLLLYPQELRNPLDRDLIYIPLCFYFIVVCAHICFFIVKIYIPLCFYFIGGLTMLRSFIYIPLCFYFIGNVDDSIVAEQNLHSTMLLLYLRSVQNLCWPSCIYIPLCFYFILCNRGFLPSLLKIYIPLCFYFISCSFLRVLLTHTHLHSTMLLLYHDRLSEIHDKELHLHSTMLLLYLSAGAQNQDTGKIYIPLCFYFITMSALMLSGRVQNLHSTMLLLYLFILSTSDMLNAIYIPLCFYFIRLQFCSQER